MQKPLTKVLNWSSNNWKMKMIHLLMTGRLQSYKNIECTYGWKGLTLPFGNWLNNSHKQMEEISKLRAEVRIFPIIVKRPQHRHSRILMLKSLVMWNRTNNGESRYNSSILCPSFHPSIHPPIHPLGLTTWKCHYLVTFDIEESQLHII